jgi:hypothetical protein
MESKGMMTQMAPPGRFRFIGKKSPQSIGQSTQSLKTVSVVPIIGEHKHLSVFNPPGLNVCMIHTRPELF